MTHRPNLGQEARSGGNPSYPAPTSRARAFRLSSRPARRAPVIAPLIAPLIAPVIAPVIAPGHCEEHRDDAISRCSRISAFAMHLLTTNRLKVLGPAA